MTSLIAFLIAVAFWALVLLFVFRALNLLWSWYALPLRAMEEVFRRHENSKFPQATD